MLETKEKNARVENGVFNNTFLLVGFVVQTILKMNPSASQLELVRLAEQEGRLSKNYDDDDDSDEEGISLVASQPINGCHVITCHSDDSLDGKPLFYMPLEGDLTDTVNLLPQLSSVFTTAHVILEDDCDLLESIPQENSSSAIQSKDIQPNLNTLANIDCGIVVNTQNQHIIQNCNTVRHMLDNSTYKSTGLDNSTFRTTFLDNTHTSTLKPNSSSNHCNAMAHNVSLPQEIFNKKNVSKKDRLDRKRYHAHFAENVDSKEDQLAKKRSIYTSGYKTQLPSFQTKEKSTKPIMRNYDHEMKDSGCFNSMEWQASVLDARKQLNKPLGNNARNHCNMFGIGRLGTKQAETMDWEQCSIIGETAWRSFSYCSINGPGEAMEGVQSYHVRSEGNQDFIIPSPKIRSRKIANSAKGSDKTKRRSRLVKQKRLSERQSTGHSSEISESKAKRCRK